MRRLIREQVKAQYQLVPPAYSREWQIDLGFAKNFLRDRPVQLRVKFNAAGKSASGTFLALWRVQFSNHRNEAQRAECVWQSIDTLF